MSSRNVESKRGPKVGDAASLWNFTPSPGWTKEEAQILKLCLMKYGVGRWVQILDTGLLPGKLIQQLNGQTQRLIGQQSLAAYTGLQVDIDRIRADNAARTSVERKSGLIIWSGPNPNKKMRDEWRKEAQARFGLEKGELKDVDELLEEVTRKVHHIRPQSGCLGIPLVSLLASDTAELPREQKLALLKQLRKALKQMHAQLQQAEAAPGSQRANCGQNVETPQTSAMAAPSEDDEAVLPVRMLVSRRSGSKLGSSKSQAVSAAQSTDGNKANSSVPGKQRPPRATKKRKGGSVADSATQTKRLASLAAKNSAQETEDDQAAAEAAHAALDVDISQLQGMGFSKSKAKEALQENNHDLEAAIEWLVANCI
ncbi:hypothetical protein ABBQ38_003225 [Trebouxia sp. C0009 RCD-2024]